MSKKLAKLNVSLNAENHIYTWKQSTNKGMVFWWLFVGAIWLFILYLVKNSRWDFIYFYALSVLIFTIIFSFYHSVLSTSVEVSSQKLSTTQTPFNLFAKSLKLEDISHVYYENPIFEKGCRVRVELKNGKSVLLLYGLKEEQAIELAQYIDNSRKHFQKVSLISKGKGITDFGD